MYSTDWRNARHCELTALATPITGRATVLGMGPVVAAHRTGRLSAAPRTHVIPWTRTLLPPGDYVAVGYYRLFATALSRPSARSPAEPPSAGRPHAQ